MTKHIVAFLLAFSAAIGVSSAQDCLHGRSEQPAQRARRQEALKVAHQINIAEAFTKRHRGKYRPLEELSNVSRAPSGLDVRLFTDSATYVFSIKDTLDSCQYAIFSDESGRIYEGYPTSGGIVLPANTQ